jgi:glucose-6-phosphate-specific signal transduction histidine kinase
MVPKATLSDPKPPSEILRDEAIQASLHLERELEAANRLALDFEQEVHSLSNRVVEKLEGEVSMLASTLHSLLTTLASRLQEKEPQLAELARIGLRSTDTLQTEVKDMLAVLRKADPDVHGLYESMDRLTKEWRAKEPNLRFEFMCDPANASAFGFPETPIEAYTQRVAEAAIDRAVNLGGAHLVVISMSRNHKELRLQIIDDGGPPAKAPGHHWKTLRQKAEALGGHLSLDRADSGGGEMLLRLDWLRKV